MDISRLLMISVFITKFIRKLIIDVLILYQALDKFLGEFAPNFHLITMLLDFRAFLCDFLEILYRAID